MNPLVFDAIADVLVNKFQVDATLVRPEATLESLGLDSLSLMEFVFALEDRFEVRIPEDRLDPRQTGLTLSDLADALDQAALARPQAVAAASSPTATATATATTASATTAARAADAGTR